MIKTQYFEIKTSIKRARLNQILKDILIKAQYFEIKAWLFWIYTSVRFKACSVYLRVRLFQIYTTVNFFFPLNSILEFDIRQLLSLFIFIYIFFFRILSIWIYVTVGFKTYVVYLKVKPFQIYTIVSFFKTFSHLPLCVCVCVCVKIFSILKRKNNKLIPHRKMSVS